tara:strand:- start:19 stop:291 length:273 start_codon:yes stop_codon:yes gene_type:complete
MRSAFKMKGMDFGNSPVTKKAGPETKQFDIDNEQKMITSQDEESAYENAQNDYDTDKPSKAQLAKALKAIQMERSREANKQERIEDAKGL